MPQNVGIFFVKFITFILFCAVGIWAGLKVLPVLTDLQYSGRLVQWQLLESEQKFRQIVDASENGVWVQAENGKYYVYYSVFCKAVICGKWLETTSPSIFYFQSAKLITSGCKSTYEWFDEVEPKYPPQKTANSLECAVVRWREPYNGAESLVYYVLLDNGDLWMWNHSPDLQITFWLLIACSLIGLSSGIVIWFYIQKVFL
jgi:hypothetical protein